LLIAIFVPPTRFCAVFSDDRIHFLLYNDFKKSHLFFHRQIVRIRRVVNDVPHIGKKGRLRCADPEKAPCGFISQIIFLFA